MTASDAPVIDLSRKGGAVVGALDHARRHWDFFQIVGYGLAPDLIAETRQAHRRFFARPRVLKRALSRTAENPWRYFDRELTKKT